MPQQHCNFASSHAVQFLEATHILYMSSTVSVDVKQSIYSSPLLQIGKDCAESTNYLGCAASYYESKMLLI